jgi:hypothetical protein
MAEQNPDGLIIPTREPLIQTRYGQILGRLTRGETVVLEEIGMDTLDRLCVFSNVALISAYVTRPDDPTLEDMESLHLALGGEYSDRVEAEQQSMLPQNVLVFPGADPEHVASVSEDIDACPALQIEDLRYLAKNALRG